jgi:hypothetical protein
MKSNGMRWPQHVARMGEMRNIHNILLRKHVGKRRVRNLRVRGKIILQESLGRINHLFSFDTTRTAWKTKKLGAGIHRQQADLIRILSVFKNKESRLNMGP